MSIDPDPVVSFSGAAIRSTMVACAYREEPQVLEFPIHLRLILTR